MTESPKGDGTDIWIDLCYILGLGINLWIIDVTLFDAAISTRVLKKLTEIVHKFGQWQERERTFVEQRPWVIFDALNIIDETGKANDG